MEDDIYQVPKSRAVKIEDDSIYQKYSLTANNEVPTEDMKYLLKMFFNKASINMGKDSYDAPDTAVENIMEFIRKDFRFIPVVYIGSTIIKGSLGKYGAGRLVPNTVYRWMNEASIEYRRDKEHTKLFSTDYNTPPTFDLFKYPLGRAINKKIDWVKKGLLHMEDWERVPLKELAEREGQKLESYPQLFGIKYES